jgi:integrase
MPKRIAPLSDIQVSKAKPKDKDYKLNDGYGLYLLVTPTGGKLWRFDYRFGGKRPTMAFGAYPAVTLADARQRREDAKKLLANGIDPVKARKDVIAEQAKDALNFETVAREWFGKNEPKWSPGHAATVIVRLERDCFPKIGSIPIAEVDTQAILSVLRHVEARGALDTAYRIKIIIGQVCRYATVNGWASGDPSAVLKPREVLQQREERHHAAITDPKQLAVLLKALDSYTGSFSVKSALRLMPMLLVRPGELQKAEWSEFDLDAAEWNIPAEKMKMKKPHLVPLPHQAVEILKALQPLTGYSKYLFPGRTSSRPMSNNTLNASLRYLGFDKDTVTAHGFRATARTILDEVLQVRPDFIEHQLAHAVKDPNGRAYNRTAHLAERKKMLQLWADYLDGLKQGAKVIPFKTKATA